MDEHPSLFTLHSSLFLRWRDWLGNGLEHVVLGEEGGFIRVRSVVIQGRPPDGFAATYSLTLHPDWSVSEVTASVLGAPESVVLRRDGAGQWIDSKDRPAEGLQGAFDVDLSITPLTNTLPIRRLSLHIGESAEITVAYISFPDLTLSPDVQRYTRLAADLYRFESVDSGFTRDITVDDDGFVVTYPGLFQRVS